MRNRFYTTRLSDGWGSAESSSAPRVSVTRQEKDPMLHLPSHQTWKLPTSLRKLTIRTYGGMSWKPNSKRDAKRRLDRELAALEERQSSIEQDTITETSEVLYKDDDETEENDDGTG